MYNIFLDSSVVIAAVFSSSGGARALLKLGEFGFVSLWTSRDALVEVEHNVAKYDQAYVAHVAHLLAAARVGITAPPSATQARRINLHINYAPDAVILAAALEIPADYFVTLDREHILRNLTLSKAVPFLLGTPGDCLAWYRSQN
ncbi:MAG: PIN domain-containing protein [Anaerolineae bacterium]|nr:PIN domain-containing protein [Anaerolineae bacterium]